MCDPMLLFASSSAMSLGSAALGSSLDAANYSRKIGAFNTEADAINKSTTFKYQQSQLQQQQAQEKATVEAGDRRSKLSEASGDALAAAATGGVEGNSIDALLRGFAVATGRDISTIYGQRDAEIGQSRAEMQGAFMDASNRKLGLQQQLPEDPRAKMLGRYFNAAFDVGKSYLGYTSSVEVPDGRGGKTTVRRFG